VWPVIWTEQLRNDEHVARLYKLARHINGIGSVIRRGKTVTSIMEEHYPEWTHGRRRGHSF
jgi:hypothetical protein